MSVFEIIEGTENPNRLRKPPEDITIKAWIAGFFDGEGHVGVGGSRGGIFQCNLSVTNTDLAVLEFIESHYGGRIFKEKVKPNQRQAYRWQVHGVASEAFVLDILPYSRVKSPQLELYLYARTLLASRNGLTPELREERYKVMDSMQGLKRADGRF